jgi:hypothetical protein
MVRAAVARRYSDLLTDGWSREGARSALGRGELHRPTRGVYSTVTMGLRDLRPLFLRLPDDAVLGFHTAAELFGWPVPRMDPGPRRRVHVIVPAGAVVPRINGVVTHEAVLPVLDRVVIGGVPCAPPARCAVDLARQLSRSDALPLLDGALRSGLCRSADLAAETALHHGLRGVLQARDLFGKAHPAAECVQESQLRLVLLDGGLPPPEPQVWVHDDGVRLYRIDLAYREQRIGIEYDGGSHLDRVRMEHDRARLNWLADHGWQMRVFTARDLYRRPGYIVATIRNLLRP